MNEADRQAAVFINLPGTPIKLIDSAYFNFITFGMSTFVPPLPLEGESLTVLNMESAQKSINKVDYHPESFH